MVWLGGVGIERKRYCEEGGLTSASGAIFGPQTGFEVELNEFFRVVLAHSDFCRTEADGELKEKCGSVGRGWNRKKMVIVMNGRFHIGIRCNFGSPNWALKLRDMCF